MSEVHVCPDTTLFFERDDEARKEEEEGTDDVDDVLFLFYPLFMQEMTRLLLLNWTLVLLMI